MIKHFCDNCGREKNSIAFDKLYMRTHRVEYTAELCHECFCKVVGLFPAYREMIEKEDKKREAREAERMAKNDQT